MSKTGIGYGPRYSQASESIAIIKNIKTVKQAILNARHKSKHVRKHCERILKENKGFTDEEIEELKSAVPDGIAYAMRFIYDEEEEDDK